MEGGAVGSSTTVRQYLDTYVDYKRNSGTIESSTANDYAISARIFSRYIGDIRPCDLTIDDVNGFMARMTKVDYSPKSVGKPFRLLKQALKHAQACDPIRKNPCDFCKPPKRGRSKVNSLNREERSRMLALCRTAEGQPLATAIELALTTGMRRGEICALRWSDLDEEKGTISVTHALGNGEGGYYPKEPKACDSLRTIPLTAHVLALLSGMKKKYRAAAEACGIKWADAFILGTQGADSRPYSPPRLGKDFKAFTVMNGFDCTFHDLRHTFATMMIAAGVDVRTVASYLGHASVSMTLDTYADVDPEAKMAAVDKIGESFDDRVNAMFDLAPSMQPAPDPNAPGVTLTFTVAQLEKMLAEARLKESAAAANAEMVEQ